MKLWVMMVMASALSASMSWAVSPRNSVQVQARLLTGVEHTISVFATDTGAQVRQRIAQLIGIPAGQLQLVAGHRFLGDRANAMTQLGEARMLFVILRLRGGGGPGTATGAVPSTTRGRLRVQWIKGQVHEIERIPNETVGELKDRLSLVFKTPVEEFRLVCRGREWLDMELVDDMGSINLHALLRMRNSHDVTDEAALWGAMAAYGGAHS